MDYKTIIEESELFDELFYLQHYQDARLSDELPLDHFIKYGLKEDRKPNEWFDPVWYREYYQDVKENGIYPCIHYLLYGLSEFRFANKEECEEYLRLKDIFNVEEYKNRYEDLNAIEDEFDFIWHYVHHGKQENRTYTVLSQEKQSPSLDIEALNETEKHEYHILSNSQIDFSEYFTKNTHPFVSENAIIDYIKCWKDYTPVIPNTFDTAYYLISYPDVKNASFNPLVHFLSSGKKEGRIPQFDRKKILIGEMTYSDTKETIIFVSHESSASGAPLLGYNIVKLLSQKYNIINIIIRQKEIHNDFLRYSFELLTNIEHDIYGSSLFYLSELKQKHTIKGIILNSIVTHPILALANQLHIPSLLLIHEFSDYTKPLGTMRTALINADNIIVPAKIINASIEEELHKLSSYQITNNMNSIHIFPQGKLPDIPQSYGKNDSPETLYKKLKIINRSNVKIVVGSGWVQPRKGVDLFVATAKYIKQHFDGLCKFIWVGDGFAPETDMAYSVWLEREIKFANLDDDFIFLGHQKNLETVFSIADVFCLTSRMDPFPNVVIDALEQDLHIACFDNASGSVEFLRKYNANCSIVDYVDTCALGENIIKYLTNGNQQSNVNNKIVKQHLNFDKYINKIDTLLSHSVKFNTQVDEISAFLLEENLFDARFYNESGNEEEQCRRYVQTSLKGLRIRNPKPGFSELVWLEKNSPNNPFVCALYESAKQGITETHTTNILPIKNISTIDFHYAVHLHLFYPELAIEYAEYFKLLPGKYDILITIVDKKDKEIANKVFSECGADTLHIRYVENIGRDSGPLYFGLQDIILNNNYEVIGHFHTKKSRDIHDGIGDRWRTFLTETLLGDIDTSHSILTLFQENKTLGLLFPEDSHVVDIGKNKAYIERLCEMLKIDKIQQTHTFPLGNMFWARLEAIKPLFALEAKEVLEPEPLPYDGSFMHAIERITPHLVQSKGFTWETVYKEGVQW